MVQTLLLRIRVHLATRLVNTFLRHIELTVRYIGQADDGSFNYQYGLKGKLLDFWNNPNTGWALLGRQKKAVTRGAGLGRNASLPPNELRTFLTLLTCTFFYPK